MSLSQKESLQSLLHTRLEQHILLMMALTEMVYRDSTYDMAIISDWIGMIRDSSDEIINEIRDFFIGAKLSSKLSEKQLVILKDYLFTFHRILLIKVTKYVVEQTRKTTINSPYQDFGDMAEKDAKEAFTNLFCDSVASKHWVEYGKDLVKKIQKQSPSESAVVNCKQEIAAAFGEYTAMMEFYNKGVFGLQDPEFTKHIQGASMRNWHNAPAALAAALAKWLLIPQRSN